MSTKQRVPNSAKKESAENLVRRVLTSVFRQNPSKKTVADVAAKIVKSLPKEAA